MGAYREVYDSWKRDPEAFWLDAAKAIDWIKPPSRACDDSRAPFFHWFADGEMNTCHNAVDRHVDGGRGDQAAIIYDSPITGGQETISYSDLRDRVAKTAGALQNIGVGKGDRVIVYMPMIPEAVIAMLACARIGAVHSVVFGGFAAHELAVRIDDAKPKAIVSASCGIEPGRVVGLQAAARRRHRAREAQARRCIIKQRDRSRLRAHRGPRPRLGRGDGAAEPHDCVPVAATDPLYILYTSGTTGQPKGVVRDNGGHCRGAATGR